LDAKANDSTYEALDAYAKYIVAAAALEGVTDLGDVSVSDHTSNNSYFYSSLANAAGVVYEYATRGPDANVYGGTGFPDVSSEQLSPYSSVLEEVQVNF
jgi:hypothetical protein